MSNNTPFVFDIYLTRCTFTHIMLVDIFIKHVSKTRSGQPLRAITYIQTNTRPTQSPANTVQVSPQRSILRSGSPQRSGELSVCSLFKVMHGLVFTRDLFWVHEQILQDRIDPVTIWNKRNLLLVPSLTYNILLVKCECFGHGKRYGHYFRTTRSGWIIHRQITDTAYCG